MNTKSAKEREGEYLVHLTFALAPLPAGFFANFCSRVWLLLVLLIAVPVRSALAGGPKIACKAAEYAFGAVEDNKPVEHVFTLSNEGDAALQIGSVRACCGATASIATNSIAPGTNTTLKVVLSLQGRSGELRKSFYVGSNDPKQP